MKILHLISSNGLFGAEKVLLDLVGGCSNHGCSAIVGAIENKHNPHLEIIEAAKDIGLPTKVFISKKTWDISTVFQVKKFMDEQDMDIIHSHNYKSDMIAFWASKLSGKKWVATNHVWHGHNIKLRFYEGLDAFFLKFAHYVTAVSDEIKEVLVKKNIKADKLQCVYNGINLEPYAKSISDEALLSLKKEFHILPEDKVLTIIGRLSPEKGHKDFFKVMQRIISHRQDIKALIVGDGPIKQELVQDIQEKGLEKYVILTGIRKDIPAILKMTDILVMPSYIEGLPITLLEAMASRVAAIATNIAAIPKVIIPEKTGLLIEPGDIDALHKFIVTLLDDAPKRQSLADNAYARVRENFSVEKMVKHYINIYQKVMA